MNGLLDQVEQSVRTRGLFRPRQRILVAVSGGVDSMALLHVLDALAAKHAWKLTVAHFNHRLRGRSSDADERLVRRTARSLGWPFVSGRGDVRWHAAAGGLSIEVAARNARHAFLAKAAARLKIPAVALAHHADDQVELFFLRLLRGSGSLGLAGMKWRNPSPADSRLLLVRPFLGVPKAALREYASEHRIRFREDASNARLDIQRNRIRHELLPLLRRRYQPALNRIVLRLMEISGAEAEWVTQVAADWLGGRDRTPFARLPIAVQRRSIQHQLSRRNLPADFDLVERLRVSPGQRLAIAADADAELGPDGTVRLYRPAVLAQPAAPMKARLEGSKGELVFDGLRIHWRRDSCRGSVRIPRQARPGQETFDADKVGSDLIVRHWRSGDRFQPIGMRMPVKLQDLFTNRKIPREQRHQLVVVTTAAGELVWVQNLRISERFKLSNRTIRRLHWRWKRL